MIDVMDRRTGATFDIPRRTIDLCPAEDWAEFSDDLAVLCGFVVAAGGWWKESNVAVAHWRVVCVGPKADIDAIAELVEALIEKWGGE